MELATDSEKQQLPRPLRYFYRGRNMTKLALEVMLNEIERSGSFKGDENRYYRCMKRGRFSIPACGYRSHVGVARVPSVITTVTQGDACSARAEGL
jgi:hypothetical protein